MVIYIRLCAGNVRRDYICDERVRRVLRGVDIVNVPGTHVYFPFTSREQMANVMRRFLTTSAPQR